MGYMSTAHMELEEDWDDDAEDDGDDAAEDHGETPER